MKKIFIFTLCLMSASPIFAQFEKGSKLVGLNIGGLSYTNSDSKTSYSNTPTVYDSKGSSFSITLNPNVAWFIAKKMAVGGGVTVGFYKSKSKNSNTGSSSTSESNNTSPSVSLSPMLRYYFGASDKGSPFIQVNAQYGITGGKSTSSTSTGSSSETKTKPKSDWSAGPTIGYEHFISKYLGFIGSIGFSYGKTTTEYDYKPSSGTGYSYTSEYSRVFVPINFGFQLHLP